MATMTAATVATTTWMERAEAGATSGAATSATAAGALTGGVRVLERLEALAIFVAALVLYARLGAGWRLFALTFLAPDLSFLGYLAGARLGAAVYNAAHSFVGPLLLAPLSLPLALVWAAHVGLDRALGYGLKYERGFGFTHLGRIGR